MAFSDNKELRNSSEDYDSEQDEYEPPAEDATFFAFDLKPEGDPGGYHVRNKPGEKQRKLASRISSGPRKRPAYDVNATARAIIHGTLDEVSQKPATLLVYDVHFFARRPRRIKAATISFEFKPQIGAKKLGPTVSQMAPFGEHSIWHSTEMVTQTIGGDAGISGGVGATVGANLSSEKSTEKTVTYAAHIIGHNPPNDWGDCLWAQWSLEENRSQKGGVVRIFRACILLTRDVGDEEFLLFPTLRVTPDTNSQIRDLVSFRREDEAIIMVPSSDPVNDLNVDLAKEKRNLGSVDLGSREGWFSNGSRLFNWHLGVDQMADAARGSLPFRGIEMLIPNMHMMEEYLENDELDLVQSTEGLPSPIFEHPASMDTEENSWRNLNLEDQCTDVLGLLSRNQRQWSADVTGGIPALELYKKNALQEGIDYLDRTAPTALHILAKRPQDFQKVPSSTQEQMMRTRSDMEARKLLFRGRVSEINKNLCFDARDQKEAHQMVELLGRLAESKFHDTLAYVNIPTVNHHSSQGLHAVSSDGRNKRLNARVGRTELEAVFNKLAEVKVKTILRLSVEDRQYPPHTDASIEKSICGKDSLSQDSGGTMRVGGSFHIETWDWRKPDLSTDVILFAAPNVEHINLYWSGSQAVLRGWDSDEGIPRLATRGKLKFVTIHATPGIETRDRVERLLQRFQAKIHEKTSDSVRVKTILQMEGWDSMNTTDNQHDWVETMDKFRAALISLPDIKTDQVKRVKVALVDDGINLGNLHMYNGNVKVTGLSFFPREYGSENPWHCSNTGHGTILANMVVRVNPRVHLCVLRVHDVATRDGGRNIFARSAARAIKSAIEQDVDVICMSWTIKTRIERSTAQLRGDGREISTADKEKPELTDIQRLEKAIDAAKEAGILMFCSASDDIMASAMDTLPYRKQPDYIFRIGAAQSLGQQDPHSEDVKRIDYFFPGHQVAEARNPRSNQAVEYHDGSSIGTALAAGLASLIIHCARLAHYSYEKRKARGVSGRNPYEGLDRALREQASMKMALDNIKKNHSPGHEKFLPVWNVFRSRTEEMAKIPKAKEDDKWEAMERLMDQLRYGIEY
ncbi:hypothetical protein Cob_v006481 [Colletotrichum orbiculare MAFF 240422]|uniref:Peptidase S8/S53 domain-containing protein n=1 Tax=Colletotrichum orbiculare (strain 104-T / ATCC 96160 / CBS 514.97 / LARS 414 / MAFF 240422) TaxID=1213857 RepID=A0A484FT62_COLOR|nr:hypothetical protein Cob_v006481 [Colletotrichum orbiculare MAFF 240422]